MALFETLLGAAVAIILFLFGIEHLSTEIQRISGERLRGVLARVMSNKWLAAAISAITTAIIQSSTATTVIAVGFVNSGLITFTQSLAVIAGANIGTTITAQLVSFNIMGVAPFFVVFGFIFSVSGGKYRFLGKPIFYFGIVFFSLSLLSGAISPLKGDPLLLDSISHLDNPMLALFVGILLTAVLQSSSVTTGIVVLLGMQGMLSLEQAIPIILGANIGTTTTTLLAAHRLDEFAKRTAIAHFTFNVLGVILFFPFIQPFGVFVQGFGGDAGRMIANAHLMFNLATALIFLIFIDRIGAAVVRFVPSGSREIVFKTKFLNGKMPGDNPGALLLVKKELAYEAGMIRELFSLSLGMMKSGNANETHRASKLEMLTDYLDDRISESLAVISARKLSDNEAAQISWLARISNEAEQLADLGEDLSRIAQRVDERGLRLHPQSLAELCEIESIFFQNLDMLERSMESTDRKKMKALRANSSRISASIQKSYASHILRLRKGCSKPVEGLGAVFTDAISVLEAADLKIISIMEHRMKMDQA